MTVTWCACSVSCSFIVSELASSEREYVEKLQYCVQVRGWLHRGESTVTNSLPPSFPPSLPPPSSLLPPPSPSQLRTTSLPPALPPPLSPSNLPKSFSSLRKSSTFTATTSSLNWSSASLNPSPSETSSSRPRTACRCMWTTAGAKQPQGECCRNTVGSLR